MGWCELYRVEKEGRFRVYKVLKPEFRDKEPYERLLRKEFEIGYSLSHPGICEVYAFFRHHSFGNAIEMEWVDGINLKEALETERWSSEKRGRILDELLDALQYIHSRQVVHKDLKPSNIMITHNGDHVKIIDFGVADQDCDVTRLPGGTRSYAAPELLEGGVADQRSDIYSLGKILTLSHPSLGRIARKCLQTDPSMRYQDVVEIKKALQRHRSRPLVWILVVLVAILGTLLWYRGFHTGMNHSPENVVLHPSVQVEDTVSDPAIIDELFRQATELIGADGQ